MRPLISNYLAVAFIWLAISHAIAAPTTLKCDTRICTRVARNLGHGPGVPPSLHVESIDGEGRESIYQSMDIDGDKVADSVKRDCGSSTYGTCSLYVRLSKGGGYDFEEETFSVIRFRSKYYVVVGNTYPQKNTRRRLYILNSQGADQICESF
jgi:hypothetical protein